MKVKICGIKSVEDLKIAVEAGADAMGFLVGQLHASTDFVLPSTASRLTSDLPPYTSPVIVTHLIDADEIFDIVKKTSISTVQMHGGSPLKEVKKLRKLMSPDSKIILAVHIVYDRPELDYEEFYPFIDAILLDSFNKNTGQVGGTGKTHNWDKSAEIVKNCKVPVILAGGLTPENVAEAIEKVKPFGVDANSGLKNEDGSRSAELCRKFVINAKTAFLNLKIHNS